VDLSGKVAIVTGSGRGLGFAYAAELARSGASVVINDVDSASADAAVEAITATGGKAVAEVVAVGTSEAAQSLVDRPFPSSVASTSWSTTLASCATRPCGRCPTSSSTS
jgi:NAD(P)-dependent dehydrogenase (short-subunit alcohol dehydrogenase family)